MDCPANAPAWLKWAWHEIGVEEELNNTGPDIRRYISIAKCGHEGDPWCAIFANAALEASSIPARAAQAPNPSATTPISYN